MTQEPAAAQPSSLPLGRLLGLSDAELGACGEMFAQITGAAGLDGAKIFQRLGAGASLAEAMSLSPRAVELLYARARQWLMIGRFDKAESLFRALVLLQPADAHFWIGYGACARSAGRRAEAAEAFATAAVNDPALATPWLHLAGLAILDGDYAAARRALAGFDARATAGLPAALRADADRMRAALAAREGAAP